MPEYETARLSTKGQFVIPETMRSRLGLVPGMSLMIMMSGNALVVEPIIPPSQKEVDRIAVRARTTRGRRTARSSLSREIDRIAGTLSLPSDFNEKDAYHAHLMEKYG